MSVSILFPILAFLGIAAFYLWCAPHRELQGVFETREEHLSFPKKRYPMTRKDTLPLLALVVVYAVTAFIGLGSTNTPQSFCKFEERGRYVVIELTEPTELSRVSYYCGIGHDVYRLQFSPNGENWHDQISMEQKHGYVFKWKEAELAANNPETRFVRITAGKTMQLGELALYDASGALIPTNKLICDAGGKLLFDEQDTVPDSYSYLTSSYFDEIYHARTAYEGLEGEPIYETTHPPLGKVIISIGISLFGLNPFGWRFSGTLFGVLMLPILYVFLKNLFGKTPIAFCGTAIFAFDFMHFVQTRIATIDTYGVFFTIAAYFFLYRFFTAEDGKWKLPLFLSGLSFGLGAASKWTVIYAGAGLALLWLLYWIFRGLELKRQDRFAEFKDELLPNIGWCLLFFVVVPCLVYYLSYFPYGKAAGMGWPEMYFSKDYAKLVLDNQSYMFNYHSDIVAEHPYASRWYQWLFNIRPILYYLEYFTGGTKSAFGAFLNPVVCWTGLIAILLCIPLTVMNRSGRALFILVGYLAQLVPWMFVDRLTFAYHYFPCLIFLVLAIAMVLDAVWDSGRKAAKPIVYSFTGICIGLFAAFYPVLTGVRASQWYTDTFLQWFESWPF